MPPLLEIKTSEKTSATYNLEQLTVQSVEAYAAFSKSKPDAVVEAALSYVFKSDKDFQAYLTNNPDATKRSRRRGRKQD
jgi:hypothetical protein